MNICSLCSRVREHMFAERMFAHVRGEHMFAGGHFLKIIISWCFAQASSVLVAQFMKLSDDKKRNLVWCLGFQDVSCPDWETVQRTKSEQCQVLEIPALDWF